MSVRVPRLRVSRQRVPLLGRVGCVAAVLVLALSAGCSGDNNTPSPPAASQPGQPIPTSQTPGSDDTPSSAETQTPAPDQTPGVPRNDLATVPTQHVIRASGLTVNATYSPRLPIADWTASANKPLALSLTTVNRGKAGQKIYLTRVTVTITARDDTGPLDSPRPLVDTANITPGFIVTFPYTYGQDFVVPALDEGATSVTLDFTYEFLLQVAKDSRDYYKQTAIDTLVVPVAG